MKSQPSLLLIPFLFFVTAERATGQESILYYGPDELPQQGKKFCEEKSNTTFDDVIQAYTKKNGAKATFDRQSHKQYGELLFVKIQQDNGPALDHVYAANLKSCEEIQLMRYAKMALAGHQKNVDPVNQMLTQRNLSPRDQQALTGGEQGSNLGEMQKKLLEKQQASQQQFENKEKAKEDRLKFYYTITGASYNELKNEGMSFEKLTGKTDDLTTTYDDEKFGIGNYSDLISHNPAYFCPLGTPCIRITSFEDWRGENCNYKITGYSFGANVISGYHPIGNWPCNLFVSDQTKSEAIQGIKKYVAGVITDSYGKTDLPYQMDDFTKEVVKGLQEGTEKMKQQMFAPYVK